MAQQSEQIAAQTQLIARLTNEVETLKKRVGQGSVEQSERIRQLELELEAARS
jgi:coronin-1B/1C/6